MANELFSERVEAVRAMLRPTAAKSLSERAFTTLSILLSFVPLVGGAFQSIVDKIGAKVNDPDFAASIDTLAVLINGSNDKSEMDSKRIDEIILKMQADDGMFSDLRLLLQDAFLSEYEPLDFVNEGGVQKVIDTTISNMKLRSSVSIGGFTIFDSGSQRASSL